MDLGLEFFFPNAGLKKGLRKMLMMPYPKKKIFMNFLGKLPKPPGGFQKLHIFPSFMENHKISPIA